MDLILTHLDIFAKPCSVGTIESSLQLRFGRRYNSDRRSWISVRVRLRVRTRVCIRMYYRAAPAYCGSGSTC